MISLLWKQWRENNRYLAMFTAWMILAAVYAVGYEVGHRLHAMVGHFSGLASFYSITAAVFLAMRTAGGEQTAGTHVFSASLPVSMRLMATYRIAGAVATLAIPILVAAVLLSLALSSGVVEQGLPRGLSASTRLPQRDTASTITALEQLWSVTAITIWGGVQLLLVVSALGCRLRSQAQIGFLGAVMAFGSMMAVEVFWFGQRNPKAQLIYGALFPQSLVIQWGYGDEHGRSYIDHEIAQYHWIALGLALPLLWIIGRIFVAQYGALRQSGSTSKPGRFRLASPTILSYIPFRWPVRWMALLWLELRQSVPLALFGLLLAVLMAIAQVFVEGPPGQSFRESVLMGMPHSTWVVGMLWAVVVGSGLYSAELGAGLGSFWRSRPIPTSMWFWCKYLVGMLCGFKRLGRSHDPGLLECSPNGNDLGNELGVRGLHADRSRAHVYVGGVRNMRDS